MEFAAEPWFLSLRIDPAFESGRMADIFETGLEEEGLGSGLPAVLSSSSDIVGESSKKSLSPCLGEERYELSFGKLTVVTVMTLNSGISMCKIAGLR